MLTEPKRTSVDLRVVFSRRVEVVVVGSKTGIFELLGLVSIEHAERGADLHAHAANLLDHVDNALEVSLASVHVSPSSAHAEAGASVGLGSTGFFEHRIKLQQGRGLCGGVVSRRLRAVRAVF